MKLTTVQDVVGVVKARGLGLRLEPGPPPMPVLVRPSRVPKEYVSEALMAALRAWRLEIIELLRSN